MDDNVWLTQFVVTPHLQHAIEVLRAAIPHRGDISAGNEGITIMHATGRVTATSVRIEIPEVDPRETLFESPLALTPAQEAAAELLLVTLAYHNYVIEQSYPPPDEAEIDAYADPHVASPDGFLKAQDTLYNNLTNGWSITVNDSKRPGVISVTLWG